MKLVVYQDLKSMVAPYLPFLCSTLDSLSWYVGPQNDFTLAQILRKLKLDSFEKYFKDKIGNYKAFT